MESRSQKWFCFSSCKVSQVPTDTCVAGAMIETGTVAVPTETGPLPTGPAGPPVIWTTNMRPTQQTGAGAGMMMSAAGKGKPTFLLPLLQLLKIC